MTDGIARLLGQRYWLTEKGWAATEPTPPPKNDTPSVPHGCHNPADGERNPDQPKDRS